MSRLTQFAASAFTKARAVIGGEALSVAGGAEISAVLAEVRRSRIYETGGWDQNIAFDAVVSLSDWTANYTAGDAAYFGKIAVARGINFRVAGIERGASFVTLRLASEKKGA